MMVDFRQATLMACTDQLVVTCVDNKIYEISYAYLLFEVHRGLVCGQEPVREITMPVSGEIITLSCGINHSGAIIHQFGCIQNHEYEPQKRSSVILWGDNTHNQLGHSNKTSREPTCVSDTATSIICVRDSTMMLEDGVVKFCGQWSATHPPIDQFVKVALLRDPARALEIRLIPGRVVVYTNHGVEQIALHGTVYGARRAPESAQGSLCQRAQYAKAIIAIHTDEGVLHAYSDTFWFNGLRICSWHDIGGL
jgi:hypothetical protein